MSFRRRSFLAAACLLAAAVSPRAVVAASSAVECGQVTAYSAPDASGPTEGSLTIGALSPWVIAADATLSAPVATNLPSLVGTSPVCLATDRDGGGVITGLDFAPQGDITGPVAFDAGNSGYDFASRLLVPTFITDTYPGLAAVFTTSADAGTDVTVTFFIDVSSGRLTNIDARAAFCGRGDLAPNGDGIVGEATIPASVLDSTDVERLASAELRHTCAAVRTQGTLDANTGALTLTTDVTITVEPAAKPRAVTVTPPPTSTIEQGGTVSSLSGLPLASLWLTGVILALFSRRRRKRG
jgi:hypothetical protein